MPDRTLSQLLSDDHATLTRKLDQQPLSGAVMARIVGRTRRRWIVLGAAIAGAVLTASQIPSLAPVHLVVLGMTVPGVWMLIGAGLIAATSAVLGWNLGQE